MSGEEIVLKTEEEWQKELDPEAYRVMREKGTEAPWSGEYVDLKADGFYHCRACGAQLFSSDDKFDSGTGWPSFTKPVEGAVGLRPDDSHGMHRTETYCVHCGGHLGHVFDDGPKEKDGKPVSGQRFCINSCSLDFEEK